MSPKAHVGAIRHSISGTHSYSSDQPAWADADRLSQVFVIEMGWAYRFSLLPNGNRHIAEFFGPGAICNWSRLSDFKSQENILFKSNSVVTALEAKRLDKLCSVDPMVHNALRRNEVLRELRAAQRTRALIQMSGADRVRILLLDLLDEQEACGLQCDKIALPLTQAELSDAIGLTPVHFSRMIGKLEDTGEIVREDVSIRLTDRDGMEASLGYKRFYSALGK